MARAFLVVLDSVGCGGAPDAAAFGDAGANTLAHIAQACARGEADGAGRAGPLRLPALDALGLGAAIRLASGAETPGLAATPSGLWGAATEVSKGKDTPSGHWELAGLPVPWEWHVFPRTIPAFPPDLMEAIATAAGTGGSLGNCHASGTEIIERLGEAHLQSGWPIAYTSGDSVLQIAAHEEAFGLQRLLSLCATLAPMVHAMRVGRVIARPFAGAPGSFARTTNRKDFALAPPAPTLLDRAEAAGREVHGVGKIADIFARSGIIHDHGGGPDPILIDRIEALIDGGAGGGALVVANLVEFDSLYGHRRDVAGYAAALERFDAALPRLTGRLRPGDMLVLTADHGNDPTAPGTDHTRERVPVLVAGLGAGTFGLVKFADVGESIAAHLGLPPGPHGRSFL